MRFVDCQGLAGHGVILGAVQAGFELVHRTALPGGFGNKIVNDNRKLLGEDFEIETGPAEEWTPQKNVGYVTGVPPCSGFSLMNTSEAAAKAAGKEKPANARGAGSSINLCQRALVDYASRCEGTDGKRGAEIVVFESVQGAFSQGLELMREFWYDLKLKTGKRYDMSHVKMSVATIGGPQFRHRYFWVAHRIPFGIDPANASTVTTVGDAIGDLVDAEEQWERQPYPDRAQTKLQRALRRRALYDHMSFDGAGYRHIQDLLKYWEPGKNVNTATLAFLADGNELPERLAKRWMGDQYKGFMWPFRLAYDEPSGVLTGGCAGTMLHPEHDRFLTVRELARVMQIPDDWSFASATTPQMAGMWIGKNCTTGAGRWIAEAVRDALAGTPQSIDNEKWHDGEYRKIELLPGERVFDITNDYKRATNLVKRKR